ncbi:hypothetical protein BH18ACI1_BH18ACI1_23590 [soil metagenome]
MTEEKLILSQIQQLPEQLKQEVLHYIEFLQAKYNSQNQKGKKEKPEARKVNTNSRPILTSRSKISKSICDVISH